MDQRTQFVLAVREQNIPVARACRDAGISRKTGYKWLERYDQHGIEGLADLPRAPATCPHKTPPHLEERILHLERLRDNLAGCIGCGCLSLKICALANPGDVLAGDGPGAVRL